MLFTRHSSLVTRHSSLLTPQQKSRTYLIAVLYPLNPSNQCSLALPSPQEMDVLKRMEQSRRSSPIMTFLNELWQLLSDLVFPPFCVKCDRPGIWFCPTCLKDVVYFPEPHCIRCDLSLEFHQMMRCTSCHKNQTSYLEGLRAVGPHVEPLQQAIHALKYEKCKSVAKPLGKLMAQCWQERAGTRVDGLLPVPLHPERKRERGFNQSALLAESMKSILEIPVYYDLLWRTRATESQVGLGAQARQDNMLNAFAASPEVRGKRWLLVDDVTTTGSTLEACAKALSRHAARSVWAITLTRPKGKN